MVDKNNKIADKNNINLKSNGTEKPKKNGTKFAALVEKEEPKEPEYDLVPPDGGWGWLVLLGSMMVNILVPGTIKSFGVLFVEFLEAFHATPTAASWIPALCYFLYSSLGPLSSILSMKYSYRTVTLLGGLSAAMGMILSYWAESVTYLYFSYGVLVGTGAGLSFPPTVYIVTSYFVKLRGLANGLCISGSALGSIILPPVLRLLLEEYGYRGAVLIMGGITLNVFVAALFYEPVEQHMIKVPRKQKALEDIPEEDDIGIVLKFESADELEKHEHKSLLSIEENLPKSPELQYLAINGDNNFVRSASAAVVQNVHKQGDNEFSVTRSRKISTPVRVPRNQTFTQGDGLQMNSQNKLNRLHALRNSSKNQLTKRSPSTSSFQYLSTPFHGSTLSFQPKEFSSHLSLASGTGASIADNQYGTDNEPAAKEKTKFFDLSLLKDPMYLVILISNSTNAISYTNFIILLPSYGISLGFDKSLAAYLISIVSTTDLIGRIGGSALSDLNLMPKTWYFVGGLAVSGISLALLPLCNTYGTLAFVCAVFGLASGIYVGITAVIMADMLGTQRLTSSYGISLFVNGILQLIGPPLCGLWFEQAQTYDPLFSTLGVILAGGAALWGFMPFIEKRNRALEEQKEREASASKAAEVENGLLADHDT